MIQSNIVTVRNTINPTTILDGKGTVGTIWTAINVKNFRYLYLFVTYRENLLTGAQKNSVGFHTEKVHDTGKFLMMTNLADGSNTRLCEQSATSNPGTEYGYMLDVRRLSTIYIRPAFTVSTDTKIEYVLSDDKEYQPDASEESRAAVLLETDKLIAEQISLVNDTWNGVHVLKSYGSPIRYTDKAENVYSVYNTEFNGETVRTTFVVPFDPALKNTKHNYRICVVTNSDKVYYQDLDDRSKFHEAALWDIPNSNQRFPTKEKSIADSQPDLYIYAPCLPEASYNIPNTAVFPLQLTNGSLKYNRFKGRAYFGWLGALCRSEKCVVFGVYTSSMMNVRHGVWMTTDGGMNWFFKYDFVGTNNPDNPVASCAINTSAITAAYASADMSLQIIDVNSPTNAVKEPTTKYTLSEAMTVTAVTNAARCVVTLSASHGIETNRWAKVIFRKINNTPYDWMTNAEAGVSNMGKVVYWAKALTATQFELYEYYGSLDGDLCARHVHAVNEIKDGFIISTGELHPNGWMLWLKQPSKDASAIVDAKNRFDVVRLNSSETGLIRSCGSLMFGDADPYILFGSDDSFLSGQAIRIEGRTFPDTPYFSNRANRSSNGIWKGKLSDIDDFSSGKWTCILDVPEPVIYMYRYGRIIVAGFQLGGLAVSGDDGETWDYFKYQYMPTVVGVIDNKMVINSVGNSYILKLK